MSNAVTTTSGGIDLDIDLSALGRALWRRKRWIIGSVIVVCAIAAIGVSVVTPRYKSESRVLVEGRENAFLRPDAEKIGSDSLVGDEQAVVNQVQVALSRDVALDVIRKLKLAERPEFDSARGGLFPFASILSLFGVGRDPLQTAPEDRVLEAYYDRLTVFAVEHSRVLVVEFQSADPELAAQVANAVAETYIVYQRLAKQDQSRGASQWLLGEIEKMRGRVAEAEAKVEAFRARSNLQLGANNTTLSTQQLGEVNTQLSASRGQRAEAETRAKMIRELLRKGGAIEASDVLNSDLIRRLSEQRAILRGQLAEQSSTLLDNHPRIKELKAQIAESDQQIRSEAEKLARAFENDARQAAARFETLSAGLDGLKQAAGSSSELDAQLRALEREAKAQRDLLESYLAKYRESTARDTIATATAADARVISRAIPSKTPYFPKKLPTIFVAALASLLLSCGIIATGEILRAPAPRNVREEETAALLDREEPVHPALGVPVAAVGDAAKRILETPAQGRRIAVLGKEPGDSGLAALTFARALCKDRRVVLVSLPVASAAAVSGLSVMSSDPAAPGLADVIRGARSIGEAITRDRLSSLHLVAAGTPGSDGGALIQSPTFMTAIEALARSYDFLVLDAGGVPESLLARVALLAPRIVVVAPVPKDGAARGEDQRLAAAGFKDVTTAATVTPDNAIAA
ncbi:MAG: GumC family protein [Xanthobacteraceae bacterium]